jgi:lipooligosaccharide transport system permease protein
MAPPIPPPIPPPTVARSTGRVPGRWGGVALVVENHWEWYRRNWRATAVSTVLQPLLFLLAFGVGFGTLVQGTGRAAEATGGAEYLVWLAPGLLAMSAVQTAAFDSTYPVLSGFKWQRVYFAMTAGPISPAQVAVGHLVWLAAKTTGAGAVYLVVIGLLGGVVGPASWCRCWSRCSPGPGWARPSPRSRPPWRPRAPPSTRSSGSWSSR